MVKLIHCISDIHGHTKELKQFLAQSNADYLFILGDIVDGWKFKGNFQKFIEKNLDVISVLSDFSADKLFILGNHDPALLSVLMEREGFKKLSNSIFQIEGLFFSGIPGSHVAPPRVTYETENYAELVVPRGMDSEPLYEMMTHQEKLTKIPYVGSFDFCKMIFDVYSNIRDNILPEPIDILLTHTPPWVPREYSDKNTTMLNYDIMFRSFGLYYALKNIDAKLVIAAHHHTIERRIVSFSAEKRTVRLIQIGDFIENHKYLSLKVDNTDFQVGIREY